MVTVYTTLNGTNAHCLSRFTGKDAHTEASARSRSFDLVHAIRKRRFKWLGHILRMPGSRLIKLAIKVQHKQGMSGNMFMDVPGSYSFEAICKLARNRKVWKLMSCSLNDKRIMDRCARLYLATHSSPQMSPRTRRRARRNPTTPPSTITTSITSITSITNSACQARRYRTRDAHAAFFAPRAEAPTATRKPCKAKKINKKPWNNKQRSAWAHAHFIINHGTAADAARFLSSEHATAVTPEVFNQVYQKSMSEHSPTAPTTTSPPSKSILPATPTTPRPPHRPATAGKLLASPSLPTPTILGHHQHSPTHTLNIFIHSPRHPLTPTPYIQFLSPITNTHLNVYTHTIYDPHHITMLNETYLYANHPQPAHTRA